MGEVNRLLDCLASWHHPNIDLPLLSQPDTGGPLDASEKTRRISIDTVPPGARFRDKPPRLFSVAMESPHLAAEALPASCPLLAEHGLVRSSPIPVVGVFQGW